MKRLLTTLKEKWPEYILEILVLVIGIYGAFELENWNENRKNTNSSVQYLRVLSKELDQNIQTLDNYLIALNNKEKNTHYYLNLLANSNEIHDTVFTEFITRVNPIWKVDIVSTAINELVRSGSIDLLKDERLNQQLLAIPGYYESIDDNYNLLEDNWSNYINPYFTKHSDLLSLWDSIGRYKMPPSNFKPHKNAFLNNLEFSNMMTIRMRFLENVSDEIKETQEALFNINEEIKKKIE